MAFTTGTKLGAYEILGPLGAGGMGEVYRARDSKLKREVAIKVLPETFSRDADRVARFQREAEVLASLNHPHIAAIYDLAAAGDLQCLVLELVEGETLADKLKRGSIPVTEALRLALQILDALDAAHEKGIVHRDLKPANIKVTHEGQVKVLDFGLAKAFAGETADVSLSNSPTLSMAATNAGVILGTAAYMSPEQAKGVAVDRRTDIFSFGAVLYELLTGRQAFQGETASEVLASVLVRDPDLMLLPPDLNPRLYDLLRRCLEKNLKRRWQAVGDLRAELEIIASDPYRKPDVAPAIAGETPKRKAIKWTLRAATALLIAALAIPAFLYFRGSEPPVEMRFLVTVPEMPNPLLITISPDGQKIAFVASAEGGANLLFVRPIDSVTAQPLAGTEGATNPFWSPDSSFIAFTAGSTLKKIAVAGGAPQVICSLVSSIPSRWTSVGAGTWNDRGVIVFSNRGRLHRVSDAGGNPELITTPDASLEESGHDWPHFLPDGNRFLYLAWSSQPGNRAIYAGELDSDRRTRIITAESMPIVSPSGFLLFQRQGTLLAQRFDISTLTLNGEPVRLAEDVAYDAARGQASFAVSDNGVLTYRSGGVLASTRQFVWFDRTGKRLSVAGPSSIYGQEFDLSPDGKQIVTSMTDPATSRSDIWVIDWERNVRSRITTSPEGRRSGPVWSPDGLRIAFNRVGSQFDVLEKSATGIGEEKVLLDTPDFEAVEAWSKDGRYIVYSYVPASAPVAVYYALPLFGDRKPFPIIDTPFSKDEPQFSFDSKWLAYHSEESGALQVHVISFPTADKKRQISTNGGVQPQWRRDGRELYYLDLDGNLMAVEVTAGSGIDSGIPKVLFDTGLSVVGCCGQYDVTPDGQRFVVQLPVAESTPTPITVVVNWTSSLP